MSSGSSAIKEVLRFRRLRPFAFMVMAMYRARKAAAPNTAAAAKIRSGQMSTSNWEQDSCAGLGSPK